MGGGASKRETGVKLLCKTALKGSTTVGDWQDHLLAAFNKWDKDKSGGLTVSELQVVFNELDVKLSPKDVEHLLKQGDLDNDGVISFSELVGWLSEAPHLEKYFQIQSEANTKLQVETKALLEQIEKESQKDSMFAMMKVAKLGLKLATLQEQTHQSLAKQLVPVIKKSFAFHDKDGSGVLEQDESIIFFSNFVGKLETNLTSIMALCNVQQLKPDQKGAIEVKSPPQMVEVLKVKMEAQIKEYSQDPDSRQKAAFAALDVNSDGKLQLNELLSALVPGTPQHLVFMEAMGLALSQEDLASASSADGAQECTQQ